MKGFSCQIFRRGAEAKREMPEYAFHDADSWCDPEKNGQSKDLIVVFGFVPYASGRVFASPRRNPYQVYLSEPYSPGTRR
jgi:hypothetical protein